MSAGKRTLSRVLVIIVSVGYGIVKSVDTLSPSCQRRGLTASMVAAVGIVYFIMSSAEGFMRASVVRYIAVLMAIFQANPCKSLCCITRQVGVAVRYCSLYLTS